MMMGGAGGGAADHLSRIPEDCLSSILSLTAPLDVCRFSAVSASVTSAAESNAVWDKFLPHDYRAMLSRSIRARAELECSSSSKKDLYFRLCHPILIDGGTRSFWLDKSTGKKCYMISARYLSIAWVDDQRYWRWANDPTIFPEVAELTMSWWFEIWGTIDTANLSPNSTYSVRLVMKNKYKDYKWNLLPFALSLRKKHDDPYMLRGRRRVRLEVRFLNDAPAAAAAADDDIIQPSAENQGWVEVNLGEFFCDGKGGEVEFRMKEVRELKKGFLVMGAVVKPSKPSLHAYSKRIPNTNEVFPDSLRKRWESLLLRESMVCKVILSARYLRVCNKMGMDDRVELKALSEEKTWSLFRKKVGAVADNSCIEPLARKVAKECRGFPLAIVEGGDRNVQDELAWSLKVQREDVESNESLKRKVFMGLKAKKFLLLLDDVWDKIDLEEVGIPLIKGGNGCKYVKIEFLAKVY
ncbi:hypothetical protein ACLOJK_007979 [Asimina triloba]